jgi:hypothetical protein
VTPGLLASSAEYGWIDRALPPDARAVVIIGAGTGRGLDAVLATRPALRAVVLEPDPRAAEAIRTALASWASPPDGRVAVLAGPNYLGGPEIARRFRELNAAPVIVHPTLDRSHPREVARARNFAAKLVFETDANESARRATAGRYLLQTLANAPRLAGEADIAVLGSLLTGIPAVVVAAGPSLDRNIHDLAPVLDRVVLIACDTAARPLLSLGVQPHFIVATDSSRSNAAHLSSLPPTDSWLVAEGSLHGSAFTHFARRTFYFRVADHEPWPWLNTLGLSASRLDTWGSVLTSAFSFAEHLGCNPIALVGADFAFTNGRPYCRGTSFEPLWASWTAGGASLDDVWRTLIERWPETSMPDVHGVPARTAPHLVAFRDWMVERVEAHPGTRVVNATGAGLLAGPRIEQASLCEVFAATEPIDRSLVQRVITAAHRSSTGDLGYVLEGVTALLSGSREELFAQWMQFSAGTVGYPAIEAALRSPEHHAWALARQPRVDDEDDQ